MKKTSIIILMLACIVAFSACQNTEANKNHLSSEKTSDQTVTNNTTSTEEDDIESNTSLSAKTATSKIVSSKEPKNNSTNSSKEESSKTADEKMYEYVRNHQVTTKKAKNMSKSELLEFIKKLVFSTSSYSFEIEFPESLIITKGTILCRFKQEHVLSDQSVSFEDLIGEFNPEELQTFLSQFPEKCITASGDSENKLFIRPDYQELFNTQNNAVYISLFGGRKNTFNASLGTTMIDILIYEKESGMYAFHFGTTLNNPDYLTGELEIQPDGSAKVIQSEDG